MPDGPVADLSRVGDPGSPEWLAQPGKPAAAERGSAVPGGEPDVQPGPDSFFLRMADASMSPRFEDGEWLLVDPDEPAEPGRYVAIEHPETGERTARLMVEAGGRRILRAADGVAAALALDRDNETMILGTVVFKGGRP